LTKLSNFHFQIYVDSRSSQVELIEYLTKEKIPEASFYSVNKSKLNIELGMPQTTDIIHLVEFWTKVEDYNGANQFRTQIDILEQISNKFKKKVIVCGAERIKTPRIRSKSGKK
jgi:hypothetical protein